MEIRLFEKHDYDDALVLVNDLQKDVYGKLLGLNELETMTFIKEMGVFPNEQQEHLYIASDHAEIVAIINLRVKEQKNDKAGSLYLKKAINTYGFWKLLKLFFIANKYFDESIDDESLYIDYIVVKREYRHQSIGSRCLKHAELLALKLHKKYLTLNVFESNKHAIAAYEKYGFKTLKRTKFPKYVVRKLHSKAILKMNKSLGD